MNRALFRQIGNIASYLIVPLVIAGAIYLITYRRFDTPIIVDLILLAIAVILWASSNPITMRGTLGKQIVGSTVSAVIIGIAAVGIIVLLNVLAQRVTVRTDLTNTQQFSVTNATTEVLKKLKEPVKVTVFYDSSQGDTSRRTVEDRLKEYSSRSDKLNVTYVDASFDPAKVRDFNIKAVPTVVFQQGSQREDVSSTDEQSFTRAILRVQSNIDRRVFFVSGHGERPIQASGTDSFSLAVQALTDNNYKVDTINLLNFSTGGTITSTDTLKLNPAGDVLVFGGPRSPFSDQEKQNALTFLKQGGKALFLDDPLASASNLPVERRDNLNDILKEYDLKFTSGLSVELDPQRRVPNNPLIFIPQTVAGSDVLRNLPDNAIILMAQSTQVDKGQNKLSTEGGGFTQLLQTSPNSFLKTDLQNLSQGFDQAKDVRGPLTVAATYQAAAKEPPAGTQNLNTRLALMGSYLFASDDRSVGVDPASGTSNYFFFLNTMNWLTETNNSVVIAPRDQDAKPFPINQSQGSFIFWSTFLGLPLLVLFVGVAVWWRRR